VVRAAGLGQHWPCSRMALSLVVISGCMVDYAAKFSLLVCMWQEPHLRVHFTALAVAHIAANLHGTYAHCRNASQRPSGAGTVVVVLLFGVVTPLMQAVHILDMAACWWTSQDPGRRPSIRPAPLDIVLEGLVFVCAAFHLRIGIILGRYRAPDSMSLLPVTFEALLALTLTTSLVSTATSLVLWDGTMSVKLSRDMYGWPGHGVGGGVRGGGLFLAHLVFRFSEVAGKSALLAVLAALWGPRRTAGYVAITYVINILALLFASHREAYPWHLGEAAILAWPLVFTNLSQFVDCPKHSAAAKNVAGLACGFRALEMAIACSFTVATILLEPELDEGFDADTSESVQAMRTWRTLYRRRAATGWGFCFLAHYLCMAGRWLGTCVCGSLGILGVPLRGTALDRAAAGIGRLPVASVGRKGGHPPTWPDPADLGGAEEKDFWPAAASLTPLIFSAGCERASAAFRLVSAVASSASLCSAFSSEPRLRMQDFEIIRLIGCGEFGRVFQVRQRSTQKLFAMKRLLKDFYAQKRMTDKAVREISTLSLARNHPFVVKLIYTIENSREWALVMEYCPLGDLQQLLLAEGFPGLALDRILRISAEVALALEYLHCNGIVFRDLKLENVVIDKEGHAKLTDFGLAKQHRGGQDAIREAELAGGVYKVFARTFCGSYGYAAPEVNPRRQVHGFAADLYSFGVLILMLLTGGEVYHDKREPPFERRLPPETPSELRELIGKFSFDFYWASHHFLQPARAAHRVEVNLDGDFVVVPRGPRGVRRQARPHRPPNSPRFPDIEGRGAASTLGPVHFPTLASGNSEAAQHRWDLAVDLVRCLTNELPEQRGTMANVKRHGFFTEEILDWRRVYPRSWWAAQLKERVLASRSARTPRRMLPQRVSKWLERAPVEELICLHDDPDLTVELLEQRCPETTVESPAQEEDQPGDFDPSFERAHGTATPPMTRASSSGSGRLSWCEYYS